MTPSSVARQRRQKKKVESAAMKLPENFHHQREENTPISGKISLFPNPNTLNNFMMAIIDLMRSSLVTSCRRHIVHGARYNEYYYKTRLKQECCNGCNEDELTEDISPTRKPSHISPTVVFQSLGVHSGSIVIVNAEEGCFEEGPNSFSV